MLAVKPLAMVMFACGLLSPRASCLAQEQVEKQIPDWGTFVDPDRDCSFSLDDSQLSITVPGTPHDLSAELDRMNAPRVVTSVSGDFTMAVIVKGDFEPGQANIPGRTAYNGAGLLVMLNEGTYIRLERAVLERGGRRQHYANFELRVDGQVERIGTPSDMALDPEASCLLRIERVGNEIRGIVRQGNRAWNELKPKKVDMDEELSVGVAAINASSKPFEAKFSGLLIEER